MLSIIDNKANACIKSFAVATLQKIQVTPGVCRYNFRCQMNTVHDALNDEHDHVAMCFYIDGDYTMLHFINVTPSGHYIDNTLGRWAEKYDCYLIRLIEKDSFLNINDIFTNYRKELRKKLPWYIRLFHDGQF